jgi:hypothetical protein
MARPSVKISVASSVKPPGSLPPVSPWWACRALDQQQFTVFIKHRGVDIVIGQMSATVIGVVAEKDITVDPSHSCCSVRVRSAPSAG